MHFPSGGDRVSLSGRHFSKWGGGSETATEGGHLCPKLQPETGAFLLTRLWPRCSLMDGVWASQLLPVNRSHFNLSFWPHSYPWWVLLDHPASFLGLPIGLCSPSAISCSLSIQRRKFVICYCKLGSFISALARPLGGVLYHQHTWDSYLEMMSVLASLSNNGTKVCSHQVHMLLS